MESITDDPQSESNSRSAGFVFDVSSLYAFLLKLKDPRKRRGVRYQLAIVLLLLILAKLSGEDKPYGIADWAKNRSAYLIEALGLKYGRMPHHSTYRRILEGVVDGEELERILLGFLSQAPQVGQSVVITAHERDAGVGVEDFGWHVVFLHRGENRPAGEATGLWLKRKH